MLSALSRIWTVLKAALAIGLLAGGSLYSAQIVDRQGVNPFTAALAEPTTTGSIKPNRPVRTLKMRQDGRNPLYGSTRETALNR